LDAEQVSAARDRRLFSVDEPQRLLRFGFKFGKGGAHAARTMMSETVSISPLQEIQIRNIFHAAGVGC
jgi:hypothetical protein